MLQCLVQLSKRVDLDNICSATEQLIGSFNTLDLLNTHAVHCVQFLCLFFFNCTVADARLISIVQEALKQVVGKSWSTPFYSTPSLALNEWNQRMCRVIYDPVTGKCLLSLLLLIWFIRKASSTEWLLPVHLVELQWKFLLNTWNVIYVVAAVDRDCCTWYLLAFTVVL